MKKTAILGSFFALGIIVIGVFSLSGFRFDMNLLKANVLGAFTVKTPYNLAQSKIAPNAFTFTYATFTKVTPKGEKSFDIPIIPFDEKVLAERDIHFNFGMYRDAWGYPVRENAYMGMHLKTEVPSGVESTQKLPAKKTSFHFIPEARAADADPAIPGLINCRANTTVTGYFKAYFEDMAVNNGAGNNVGYDDPVYGQARRDAACQALQDLGTLLSLDQTTVTPDIIFTVDPGNLPSNALAAASSYYGQNVLNLDNGFLHKHIVSRQNPTPVFGNFDAFVITNFNSAIHWDTDSNLNANTYSLRTIITHEAMHALGFRSLLPATISATNVSRPHSTFDLGLFKAPNSVGKFFNQHILQVPVGAPSPWFVTNSNFYQGVRNDINATPGPVDPSYSPYSWEEGSSLSHFDMARSNGQTFVMNPSIGTNTTRTLHPDEKEVLCQEGYQVQGLPGCDEKTPFANDDLMVLPSNTTVCIRPFENDVFWGFVNLYSVTPVQTQPGDVITYYSNAFNCTGATIANPNGAKSIGLTTGSVQGPRTMLYTFKDSTTSRISLPGTITTISCNLANLQEHICNGDFEMGSNPPITGVTSSWNDQFDTFGSMTPYNSRVPVWGGDGTSDLVVKNLPGPHSIINFPYITAPLQLSLDMVDSGKFAAGMGNFDTSITSVSLESIRTQLITPLVVGQQYRLSFDTRLLDLTHPSFGYGTIIAEMSTQPDLPPYSNSLTVAQVQAPLNQPSSWTHISQVFTATQPFEYLVLYPLPGSFGSGGYHLNDIAYAYVDNVSILPASSSTGNASISGIVYNDTNANGTKNANETGLNGVSVSLYRQTNTATPLQTAQTSGLPDLGKYIFNNVPNGNYYVVISNENLYQQVTQPGVNNPLLVPGFRHATTVSIVNGLAVVNNNFGVTLATAPDVCPNVTGIQTTVPSGYQLISGRCYQVVVAPQQPTRVPLPATPLTLPDLIVADFTWTPVAPRVRVITNPVNEPSPNTNFQVAVTIKNIGTATAILPVGTQMSMSENGTVYGANMIFANPVTIPVGQSYTFTIYQTSVPNIRATARTFPLTVTVDEYGVGQYGAPAYAVKELNEGNNTLTKSITILP